MTYQPSETKSPSTRFNIFPDYYAIIHSTKDAPQWMNDIRQEGLLTALLKQQNKLRGDIEDLRQQLSIAGLNLGSETQKKVSQQLTAAEGQYAKVTRNIELCKYLSDDLRRARYEKFYEQILTSPPNTELEKTLLAQWNNYNRSMNKASLSQTSSTSSSAPAEQKSATRVIPQNNDDADLQKALAESNQTFFAEEQRRAEQRQQAELQKQLTELLKNYSDLKKEYAVEDIAILLEDPLKKLNSAFPGLKLDFSHLENLTTENNEHKNR
ncbi:MAG TPA: hypothetical protein VHE99_03785 [Gammaproteobacteria bacterium]|nr:hypothetical protein [Gammaproteobacteria bacterium]